MGTYHLTAFELPHRVVERYAARCRRIAAGAGAFVLAMLLAQLVA